MNRIRSTLSSSLLVAISACGNDTPGVHPDDDESVQSALIIPRPRVDRIHGAICTIAGGCEITIEGGNFRAGRATVLINNTPVPTCRTVTIDKLVCTVPAAGSAKGAVKLEVTNDLGNPAKTWSLSDGFFYVSQLIDPWPMRTLRAKGVPIAAVVAKLNNDEYPDIAVISQGLDAVEVFLGQADARSFSAPIEVPVGLSPSALVTADFDQDGVGDLAVANAGSNDLTVLWSIKGSSYTARSVRIAPIFHTCKQPNSLVVGEANKDGYPDLVMSCAGATGLSATVFGYVNQRTGFAQSDSEIIPIGTREIQVADATDEPYLDLITFGESTNRIGVQYCKETTGFAFNNKSGSALGLIGKSISAIATGNITEGAQHDLVALTSDTKEILVLPASTNPAKQYFPEITQRIKVGAAYQQLLLADVDGDSRADLIAIVSQAGKSDTTEILLGAATGGFTSPQALSFGFAVPRAAVGDVDGDKLADLLLLGADTPYTTEDDDGKAIHVLLNQTGTFSLPTTLLAGAKPAALLSTNLDADTEAEVLALDRAGKVMVLDEERTGGFSARPAVELKELGGLVTADAMALSEDHGTLAVLHSDADTFSTLTIDGTGALTLERFHEALAKGDRPNFIPSDIAMGDFVRGGGQEIMLSFSQYDASSPMSSKEGALIWYKRSGAKWEPGSVKLPTGGREPLALSRVYINSVPYAFYANAGSDSVGYWAGVRKPVLLKDHTGRSPTALIDCTLNAAMGTPVSLISADTADDTLTLQILDSKGVFERRSSLPVCAEPSTLWCGDVNHDGVADLVVGCNGNGSTPPVAELYYGGGNGSFLREKSQVRRPGYGPITVVAGAGRLRAIIAADESRGTTWAITPRP